MALDGKVVIITGGAMGIGRYNARTFAAQGARVAVADISPMDTVAGEVARLGGELITVPTDVRDEEQVRELMSQVNARYGRIDVLINGAGIVTHFGWNPRWPAVKEMPLDFFDRVMRTNLYGTFLCTKHVLPYMQAQRSGHIINFGQAKVFGAEARPEAGAAIYHVTKVGIEVFTEEVAPELREFNICMVSMSPGATVTEEARRKYVPGRAAWKRSAIGTSSLRKRPWNSVDTTLRLRMDASCEAEAWRANDARRAKVEVGPGMEAPFKITELNHIVIYVRDLKKSIAFYRMLGLPIEDRTPDGRHLCRSAQSNGCCCAKLLFQTAMGTFSTSISSSRGRAKSRTCWNTFVPMERSRTSKDRRTRGAALCSSTFGTRMAIRSSCALSWRTTVADTIANGPAGRSMATGARARRCARRAPGSSNVGGGDRPGRSFPWSAWHAFRRRRRLKRSSQAHRRPMSQPSASSRRWRRSTRGFQKCACEPLRRPGIGRGGRAGERGTHHPGQHCAVSP